MTDMRFRARREWSAASSDLAIDAGSVCFAHTDFPRFPPMKSPNIAGRPAG